jgi:hypothetical protein
MRFARFYLWIYVLIYNFHLHGLHIFCLASVCIVPYEKYGKLSKRLSYSCNSTIECGEQKKTKRVNTQHEKFFPLSSKRAENDV